MGVSENGGSALEHPRAVGCGEQYGAEVWMCSDMLLRPLPSFHLWNNPQTTEVQLTLI